MEKHFFLLHSLIFIIAHFCEFIRIRALNQTYMIQFYCGSTVLTQNQEFCIFVVSECLFKGKRSENNSVTKGVHTSCMHVFDYTCIRSFI